MELLTAADAERRQRRAAAGLAAMGVEVGQAVAFVLPGSADLLCAVLGAARVGIIPVLLNPGLTAGEAQTQLDLVNPALVVQDPNVLHRLFGAGDAELAPHPLTRPVHFTSGTTGAAKAVTTGIFDEATAASVVADEAELWELDGSDRFLMCSPMHHTVAIRFAVTALAAGAELLVTRHFEATDVLATLREARPTAAFMVPTHLQRVLGLGELGTEERFDSLRYLVHAGSSCPPALKRAAMAKVGGRGVVEFYGSTEAQFTYASQEDWLEHPGTVGRARQGRVLSIDPGPDRGDVGTIWCTQPGFARFAYLDDPVATAKAWRGDACSVGDLGELDADGFLYLTGRRDDLVITGGVNVYPAEVEAALAGTPGLVELAVFGVDDDAWGQRVCCAVVGEEGVEVALRAVAADRLAPFKRPKSYYRCEALPTTSTGKVLRRALPALFGLT